MKAVLDLVSRTAIDPALAVLPPNLDSVKARVMLLAIGQQESRLMYRRQIGGPARGLWQFEQGTRASRGGVWGVYLFKKTTQMLVDLCRSRDCPIDPAVIYAHLERDDVLAAGVARILLFTDPKPLPELDDVEGAWKLYAERTWRPGKPHRHTWDAYHAAAVGYVVGQAP